MRQQPNWEDLSNISDRAASLKESGRLDYGIWRGLVSEAENACFGDREYTEFLMRFAQSEWVSRLLAEWKSESGTRRVA